MPSKNIYLFILYFWLGPKLQVCSGSQFVAAEKKEDHMYNFRSLPVNQRLQKRNQTFKRKTKRSNSKLQFRKLLKVQECPWLYTCQRITSRELSPSYNSEVYLFILLKWPIIIIIKEEKKFGKAPRDEALSTQPLPLRLSLYRSRSGQPPPRPSSLPLSL